MRSRKTWTLPALLCFCAGMSQASAATFQFITLQPSFNVGLNQTVDIPIYFRETHDGTSTLEAENGLSTAGFTASNNTPSLADVLSAGDVTVNTTDFFDQPNSTVSVSSGLVDVSLIASSFDSGPTGDVAGNTNTVYLATLRYTASATPGIATITLDDRNTASSSINTTTFDNITPLDPESNPFSFSVQVIPEPASASVLLGIGGLLLGRRRRDTV